MLATLKFSRIDGLHIGGKPPPLGGVTIHCDRVERRLSSMGAQTPVVSLGRPPGHLKELVRTLSLLARASWKRVPIWIHFSTIEGWRALRLIAILVCLRRARVYLVPHSGLFPYEFQGHSLVAALLRRACAAASGAMCFSAQIQEAIEIACPRLDLVRADSFVPDELLQRIRQEVCEPKEEVSRILMSGYRTSIYGYLEAIEAVALMRSWGLAVRLELYVYGDTDINYWRRVERAAKDADYIDIIEGASQETFLRAVRHADLYLRNTTHDSYGVACVEAVFLGCRSLASDVCGRGEGVQTFRKGNTYVLSSAVARCLSMPPVVPRRSPDGAKAYMYVIARARVG